MVNVGQENPPIWKIDGKVLLQKYVAFKQDEKILYRNTQTVSKLILYTNIKYNELFLINLLCSILIGIPT